jgi:hypothetical protein
MHLLTSRGRREQEFEQEVQRQRGLGGAARARARARRPTAGMFGGRGGSESSSRRDFLGYYHVLGLAGRQGKHHWSRLHVLHSAVCEQDYARHHIHSHQQHLHCELQYD